MSVRGAFLAGCFTAKHLTILGFFGVPLSAQKKMLLADHMPSVLRLFDLSQFQKSMYSEMCRYGVKLVDGENALSGPGIERVQFCLLEVFKEAETAAGNSELCNPFRVSTESKEVDDR